LGKNVFEIIFDKQSASLIVYFMASSKGAILFRKTAVDVYHIDSGCLMSNTALSIKREATWKKLLK
jgi:hypothetical protein